MTKPKRQRRAPDARQRSFLDVLDPGAELIEVPEPVEPARGDAWLRERLNAALRASGLAREAVAEALSERAGRRITRAMIDGWTGASRPHALPAALVPDICAVLGNTLLLGGIAEASGCRIAEGYELQLARLGQITLCIGIAKREQDELIRRLPLFRGEAAHA